MTRPTRETSAGRAYLDVKKLAVAGGRSTEELHQLYALEGFLARLAMTDQVDRLVLKGGVLLAAFGMRRPTRDVDLHGLDLPNDLETVLDVVRTVASVQLDDGLRFDPAGARAQVIRDDDEYSGVRVHISAGLARARLPFHVDVNVGDPVWPEPDWLTLPKLLGGAIRLRGYPLAMVHAEKIVTAVDRGTANTRWRDFGDVWTLSRRYAVHGDDLTRAIRKVATHRAVGLVPLADVLEGFAPIAQRGWAAWRRRYQREDLPADFVDVLRHVATFADPALENSVSGRTWGPDLARWL